MAEVTIASLQAELAAEKAKNATLQGKLDELTKGFDIKDYLKRREAKDAEEKEYQKALESSFV